MRAGDRVTWNAGRGSREGWVRGARGGGEPGRGTEPGGRKTGFLSQAPGRGSRAGGGAGMPVALGYLETKGKRRKAGVLLWFLLFLQI